jgi:ubiquinone/menaquinone biosynthesis C-methylase UbiE
MTELAAGAERLFSGQISAEYDMLDVICPAAAAMSNRVGEYVASLPDGPLNVLEIGCGTGVTTRALLRRPGAIVTALDNEPAMLDQAGARLSEYIVDGRVRLVEADALSGLATLPSGGAAVVASAYTIHNFLEPYRLAVLAEIFRVLKPGGVFVNGDRYALDDTKQHTKLTQDEALHYFKTFAALNRYDLLEQWIIHLFSDESADHIMRLQRSLEAMRTIGFEPADVHFRDGVNALVAARKPAA